MKDKWNASYLKLLCRRLNLNPNFIIDIGVGYGTPELYKAFPNKNFILVEPLLEFEKPITEICSIYKAKWVKKAAGSIKQKKGLKVDELDLQVSSFYDKSSLTTTNNRIYEKFIQVDILDNIVDEVESQGPYLLKIDTEGHELDVLKGAKNVLAKTELIIAEVSIAKRYHDSYTFAELIAFLNTVGFSLLDVLNQTKTPPRFMDMVFTKKPWVKNSK